MRWLVGVAAMGVLVGCVPDPVPAPARLVITTELEWCGGVIPPPGEPWCHTNPVTADVVVRQGRDVVASGTSTAAAGLVVEVPAGRLSVAVVDPPVYMTCDEPVVTAVAGADTPVLQTCHVFAP